MNDTFSSRGEEAVEDSCCFADGLDLECCNQHTSEARLVNGHSPQQTLDKSNLPTGTTLTSVIIRSGEGSLFGTESARDKHQIFTPENCANYVRKCDRSLFRRFKSDYLEYHLNVPSIKYGMVTFPFLISAGWILGFILFGNEALPGGHIFTLIVLEVTCITFGELSSWMGLPPMFGMLAGGIILKNLIIPMMDMRLEPNVLHPFRAMAVVVLIGRGAMTINPTAIAKYWNLAPILGVLPCLVEAFVVSVSAYHVVGLDPAWAALTGALFASMSAVVVMPLLAKQDRLCCGKNSQVIGIIRAACGLDAIISICLSNIGMGFIFSTGELFDGLSKSFGEVMLGLLCGSAWGLLSGLLLDERVGALARVFAVFSGGTTSLIGLNKLGYPRGGGVGVFMVSFDDVNSKFTRLWFFFQPLLFGIMGIRTDLNSVEWAIMWKGAICLVLGFTARLLTVIGVSGCDRGMSWNHRVFLAMSWMPKGTVQAAVGPVAVDTVLALDCGSEARTLGLHVMHLCVGLILFSASVGSTCFKFWGERLLRSETGDVRVQ